MFHARTQQEIEAVQVDTEVVGVSDEQLREIAEHTATDNVLQQLQDVIVHEWPERNKLYSRF